MIRLALAALTVAAAASPALAYSTQQIQAPHASSHEFGRAAVSRMAPSGVSSNTLRDPAKPGDDAKTVVYDLPANPKAEGRMDINDPKDNPFIARHLK